MTEKPPVSMTKTGSAPVAGSTPKPNPPRTVVLAAAALLASGLCALGAAASLNWLRSWLLASGVKHNPDVGKKNHQTHAELVNQVGKTVTSQLVASAVVLVALALVAFAAYRGRYWARWGVIGLWVLATFTGTLAGLGSVLLIAQSEPAVFKILAFLAGILLIAGVVLVSLRPSSAYFALNKPVRAAGAPQRRGLFAPRDPAQPRPAGGRAGAAAARSAAAAARSEATTRPATDTKPDRSRSKQRANAEAVARGAELARTRARASKSRRTVE